MIRGVRQVGACAVLAVVVAGCGGSTQAENAIPTVPSISNAKSVSGVDPCDLLTDEQLATVGLRAQGKPKDSEDGPTCVWKASPDRKITLTMFNGKHGLTTLLHRSGPDTTRVRIEGYPALETFTDEGRYCRYEVGYAEGEAFIVTMTGGKPDSCVALHQVMPAILNSMTTAGDAQPVVN